MSQPTGPLQQKVSQYRDANGQLTETSPTELSDLSAQAGLQANPTSAVVAGQIGANADQQKMAAAPQTVQASLQASQLPPQQNLATAQATQQANSTQTAQDQAQKNAGQQMQGLSDTGTRVQDAINAAVSKITAAPSAGSATTVAAPAVDTTNALYSAAANKPQLTTDLQTLQADPSNPAALAAVNTDLGRDVNSQLSSTELQGLYQSANDTITGNVATQMPTGITVGQIAQQPGFQYSMPQLATMLGVDPTALAGYSMAQLSQAVAAEQQKEFSRSQQTDQMATSQNLGTAERATAQSQGRDLAAQGVRATEDDVSKLQQSVANGDKVQFDGQTYTAEDLLGNQQVSKTVAAYLAAPEGSDTRNQLQATEPDLVNYINQHQAILQDATDAMASNATSLAGTQTANAAIGTYGSNKLDDTTLAAIIPGYDPSKISATGYDSSSPVLSYLNGLSSTDAETAAGAINTLTDDQKKELATLSPTELTAMKLQLGNQSPVIQTLENAANTQKTIQSLDPSNPDGVAAAITGVPGTTMASLQAQVTQAYQASKMGLTTYGNAGGLDSNGDGVIDDPATLIANMQKQAGTGTLSIADAEAGKTQSITPTTFTAYDDTTQDANQKIIVNRLAPYVANGPVNAATLTKAGVLTNDSLTRELVSSGMVKNMDPATQKAVQTAVAKFNVTNSKNLATQYPVFSMATMKNLSSPTASASDLSTAEQNLQTEYTKLQGQVNLKSDQLDMPTIQATLNQLKSQIGTVQQAIVSAQNNKVQGTAAARTSLLQGIQGGKATYSSPYTTNTKGGSGGY